MKKTTIAISFLIIGYWTGNAFSDSRTQADLRKQAYDHEQSSKANFQALLVCEDKYKALKNGDLTKATEIELSQDAHNGW